MKGKSRCHGPGLKHSHFYLLQKENCLVSLVSVLVYLLSSLFCLLSVLTGSILCKYSAFCLI